MVFEIFYGASKKWKNGNQPLTNKVYMELLSIDFIAIIVRLSYWFWSYSGALEKFVAWFEQTENVVHSELTICKKIKTV